MLPCSRPPWSCLFSRAKCPMSSCQRALFLLLRSPSQDHCSHTLWTCLILQHCIVQVAQVWWSSKQWIAAGFWGEESLCGVQEGTKRYSKEIWGLCLSAAEELELEMLASLFSACLGAVTGEAVAEYSFDLLTSPYGWGSLFNSLVVEVTSVSETG